MTRQPDTFPVRWEGEIEKGTPIWQAARERRKQVTAYERQQKALVRKRDKTCRWPRCGHCRLLKPRLEVAHALRSKSAGGSSDAAAMMLLCMLSHMDQEQHRTKVVPLTDQGTSGPCAFFWRTPDEKWALVAKERAVGVLET